MTVRALIGTILDKRYCIDTFVGAGEEGGLVYRAHEITTGTFAAVRCPGVPAELGGLEYEQAMDAFLAEAKVLARASETSNDVEKLLAWGIAPATAGGRARFPFCIFEWLEGESLEQHMASRFVATQESSILSITDALAILEPAARGLVTAHALGITHRDVRPRNLWLATVDARTRLKLTQFVLASRIGTGPTGAESVFAPHYAAPEHFKKSYGTVGPHTDVYGLALCLVELVSGRRALEGGDATELYLATSDLTRRPTLRARGVQISDAVEGVIARAVAVDPKRRWVNARELWDALVAAVPELTPIVPAVSLPPPTSDGGTHERRSSMPPALPTRSSPTSRPPPSIWSARDQSSAAALLNKSDDARLESGKVARFEDPSAAKTTNISAAPKRERASRLAWIAVLLLGAVAAGAVFLRLKRASSSPTSVPIAIATAEASTTEVAGVIDAASEATTTPSSEDAVTLQPFLTDMVKVPPGKFKMGSDRDPKDGPVHMVTISKAFYIDRTEVTASMYSTCIADGACTQNRVHAGDVVEISWGCNNGKDHPEHPANCVDRTQAEKFCAHVHKRLPTEAEWEWAARGADGREYPWGNTVATRCTTAILYQLAGDCHDRKGPGEVGRTPNGRSAFGALDMAGNVWEWVADGYELYPSTEVTDPRVAGTATGKGVLRGGAWDYAAVSAKTTFRYPVYANLGNVSIGFRCARD